MAVNNTRVNTVYDTPKLSKEEFHKQNENGLQRAYNSPNSLYKNNDTLYIASTKNARDVYDDIKIPFGLTRYRQRYMDADKVLQRPEYSTSHWSFPFGVGSLRVSKKSSGA